MSAREIKYVAELPEKDGSAWMIQYYVSTIKPKRKNSLGRHVCGGYVRRRVLNHPFADKRGYVAEHRLIMEEHLRRFLKPTEFIHHIDRNKTNNKLSNLRLYDGQGKHAKDHLIGKRNPNGSFVAADPIFNEIKFRLLNKDTGLVDIYTLSKLIGTTFRKGCFEYGGRFTGLKDKKRTKEYPEGQEIYEGDDVDVSMSFEGGTLPHRGVIVYDNVFGAFGTKNDAGVTLLHNHCLHTLEIIGNIHEENKE